MKKVLNLISIFFVLWIIPGHKLIAQSRNIGAPELQEFAACADLSFNSFTVVATLSPGDALPPDNQFILELSAPDGSFTNDTEVQELARVTGPNNGTAAEQDIRFENFSIPQNVSSDTYKMRVRTSTASPELVSQLSDDTSMHFFINNLNIFLNERKNVILCNVTSFSKTLTIRLEDLEGNAVNADDYTWEWFRDGAPIAGQSGSSIDITSVGNYYARIPLGGCQNFFSFEETNRVDVSIIEVSSVFIETPSPDFSFCPNESKVLSSSVQDTRYAYQWYKDGQAIEDEVNPSITLPDNNFGGEYTLNINFSEDCQLTTAPVTVVNEGSSITEPLPPNLILLPTQVMTLQITTDAPEGSNVRWYVNTSLQSQGPLVGNTSSFDGSFIGTYRVEIEAQDPCNSFLFSQTELFTPTGFEMVIKAQEDVCTAETFTLELSEILGTTVTDLKIPLTEEQLSFFNFEWYRNGVATGETSTSLQIPTSDESISYELRADLKTGEFTDIRSNELSVVFIPDDIVIQADPLILSEDNPVTLSVPQNDNFTYQWFRIVDGEEIAIDEQTSNTLTVQDPGEYFVQISSVCTLKVPSITLGAAGKSEVIPNIVTPNSDGINDNWLLPSTLFNQQDVEITIYNARGQVDFTSTSYQNNWPIENSKSEGKDPIYYYIITKNNSIVRKGSITVMR